ncbi:RHS repeat protein [Desulfonema ishimotonii]|uniref:RHS repeat protein n=1 Tax=Desulfonema ishimotonii TaxID=45657 RepID=A0A401FVG9_9BACT|nr:RHS repeat protein [Desulfonema ishimotonii]
MGKDLSYKERCNEKEPTGLTPCQLLLWLLKRDKDCVEMREEFDRKWGRDHSSQIQERNKAIKKTLKKLENRCRHKGYKMG